MEERNEITERKSLVQLQAEIETALIESEGELTEAIAAKLAKVAEKVDGSVFVLERFEKISDHYVEKAEKLLSIARAAQEAQKRLKEYIKSVMEMSVTNELLGDDFRFLTTKGKGSVVIDKDTEFLLPPEYVITKTTTTPDKKKIAAALEAGKEVPGAKIEYTAQLRVYPRKM